VQPGGHHVLARRGPVLLLRDQLNLRAMIAIEAFRLQWPNSK
jgi:hypothetical protein